MMQKITGFDVIFGIGTPIVVADLIWNLIQLNSVQESNWILVISLGLYGGIIGLIPYLVTWYFNIRDMTVGVTFIIIFFVFKLFSRVNLIVDVSFSVFFIVIAITYLWERVVRKNTEI